MDFEARGTELNRRNENILDLVEATKRLLDIQIRDMEFHLRQQEKDLNNSPKPANIALISDLITKENDLLKEEYKLRIALLEERLASREAEVERLHGVIEDVLQNSLS